LLLGFCRAAHSARVNRTDKPLLKLSRSSVRASSIIQYPLGNRLLALLGRSRSGNSGGAARPSSECPLPLVPSPAAAGEAFPEPVRASRTAAAGAFSSLRRGFLGGGAARVSATGHGGGGGARWAADPVSLRPDPALPTPHLRGGRAGLVRRPAASARASGSATALQGREASGSVVCYVGPRGGSCGATASGEGAVEDDCGWAALTGMVPGERQHQARRQRCGGAGCCAWRLGMAPAGGGMAVGYCGGLARRPVRYRAAFGW
jgi:hypothetical protein